jgi:hypothetical protein
MIHEASGPQKQTHAALARRKHDGEIAVRKVLFVLVCELCNHAAAAPYFVARAPGPRGEKALYCIVLFFLGGLGGLTGSKRDGMGWNGIIRWPDCCVCVNGESGRKNKGGFRVTMLRLFLNFCSGLYGISRSLHVASTWTSTV